MNAAYVNTQTPAFTLNEAMEVKSHFQYLVGKTYNPGDPALGQIEALFICPHGEGEELIGEYRKKKITDLMALKAELDRMIDQCECGIVDDCRIIETLSPK